MKYVGRARIIQPLLEDAGLDAVALLRLSQFADELTGSRVDSAEEVLFEFGSLRWCEGAQRIRQRPLVAADRLEAEAADDVLAAVVLHQLERNLSVTLERFGETKDRLPADSPSWMSLLFFMARTVS